MAEKRQKIVGHHAEAKGGFGGEEIFETEVIGSKVVLELLDPVLRIGPAVVEPEDLDGRKPQVADKEAVTIGRIIEESLPGGFGKGIQAFAYHHIFSLLSIQGLKFHIADLQSGNYFAPLSQSPHQVFEVLVETDGDDVGIISCFQPLQKGLGVKAAIGSNQTDGMIFEHVIEGLL